MAKRIVYSRADGSVTAVHISDENRRVGETEQDFLARMAATSVPRDALGIKVVEDGDDAPIALSPLASLPQSAGGAPQQPMSIIVNNHIPGQEVKSSYLWARNEKPATPEAGETEPLPEAPQRQQETYSLKDLLESATEDDGAPIVIPPLPAEPVLEPPVRPLPPVPVEDALSEATRRRAAKATVRKAVAEVMKLTTDQQFKYEQAMLVLNKNVDAMNDVKMLAAIEGVTVQEWARRTAAQHEARRRRGTQVWALEARAMQDIDAARGDDIDEVARLAAAEIIGEDE